MVATGDFVCTTHVLERHHHNLRLRSDCEYSEHWPQRKMEAVVSYCRGLSKGHTPGEDGLARCLGSVDLEWRYLKVLWSYDLEVGMEVAHTHQWSSPYLLGWDLAADG